MAKIFKNNFLQIIVLLIIILLIAVLLLLFSKKNIPEYFGNKLYVGNLSYSARDGDLEHAFGQFGSVTSAKVMVERDTGRSKGFGFVEMSSDAEAEAAITAMHNQPLGGRLLVVNEARSMEFRPPRRGFGGGYGGGGVGSSNTRSRGSGKGYNEGKGGY